MEEFEKQLIEIFNNCSLPFEAKRYVWHHVNSIIEGTYQTMKSKQEEKPDEQMSHTDNVG